MNPMSRPHRSWSVGLVLLLAVVAVGFWFRSARAQAVAVEHAQVAAASMSSASSLWPILGLGADDHEGAVMGDPERLGIPPEGSAWTSPGPMETSGFVVAWARLKADFAATAIGSISKDGSSWTEVTRSNANANRSLPHLNLVLPVPEGYHFRLVLEGARGGGLEIIDASGGHWFPMGAPSR
jgi:hypothetical protein